MRKYISSFIIAAFLPVWVIDAVVLVEKSKEQEAKELQETEKRMDQRIVRLGKMLERYARIRNWNIIYTPRQSIVRKGDNYLEMEVYSFIPATPFSNKAAGAKYKRIRLYFSGNTLNKIESEVIEQNFEEHTFYRTVVVDPSPLTEDSSDIQFETQFNEEEPYKNTLSNVENTITNPLRIKFKREFYIPHLTYFEKMFRKTEEYQIRYGVNQDLIAIERLKRSLEY